MIPPRAYVRERLVLGLISLSLIASFLMQACGQKGSCPKGIEATLFLDARSGWQDTGLRVKKGQRLSIDCSGMWAVAPENESQRWPGTGPEGHGNHPGEKIHRKGDAKKELPGVPFGALLGKVSDAIFLIGDQREIVAPAEGAFYLVINDYPFYRHDNRGGLTITIVLK